MRGKWISPSPFPPSLSLCCHFPSLPSLLRDTSATSDLTRYSYNTKGQYFELGIVPFPDLPKPVKRTNLPIWLHTQSHTSYPESDRRVFQAVLFTGVTGQGYIPTFQVTLSSLSKTDSGILLFRDIHSRSFIRNHISGYVGTGYPHLYSVF